MIDPEESTDISNLITALVGDSFADTGIPSSEAIPVIQDLDQIDDTTLNERMVLLTGKFTSGTRSQVSQKLAEFGAIMQNTASSKTEIVVIGSEGSPLWTHKQHGGKLAKALALRAKGHSPRIYVEGQLRDLLKAQ